MDLVRTKKKLIDKIQSSTDEVLLVELWDVIEQYDVVVKLSDEQNKKLKERIKRVEQGNAKYEDVRKAVKEIKARLK